MGPFSAIMMIFQSMKSVRLIRLYSQNVIQTQTQAQAQAQFITHRPLVHYLAIHLCPFTIFRKYIY